MRGFNSDLSNKLLVLIDGRSVYSPLYAGVFWDAQDTLLADVDRIEVVADAGGTIWGANAVNGVINIITRSAAETHGLYAETGGGSGEEVFGAIRYGDRRIGGRAPLRQALRARHLVERGRHRRSRRLARLAGRIQRALERNGYRYVDALPNPGIPRHLTVDVSLGWNPTEKLSTSLTVPSLNDERHVEYGPLAIERSVFLRLAWRL